MQANVIVSSSEWDSESTPTIHQILHASEEVWRELALLADADPAYCERMRARLHNQTPSPKPKRQPRRRKSTRTPRRSWRASAVLSRRLAQATLEALARVNEQAAEDGDHPGIASTEISPQPERDT
jgi:hypothetical protein